MLKQDEELALTALKVLEKINLSQGFKSMRYLVNLINTQPTDSVIGEYGQFLFVKMLSTSEGYKFLKNNGWLDSKHELWVSEFNKRYTMMLETALVIAVNNEDFKNEDKLGYYKFFVLFHFCFVCVFFCLFVCTLWLHVVNCEIAYMCFH